MSSTSESIERPHENFQIEARERSRLVRQPRFDALAVECTLCIDGQDYKIVDFSAFGVCVQLEAGHKMPPTSTHGHRLRRRRCHRRGRARAGAPV